MKLPVRSVRIQFVWFFSVIQYRAVVLGRFQLPSPFRYLSHKSCVYQSWPLSVSRLNHPVAIAFRDRLTSGRVESRLCMCVVCDFSPASSHSF